MIKELQRRPLSRPLFLWITGILLQTTFSLQRLSIVLLLIPFGIWGMSLFIQKTYSGVAYQFRWVWGMVFIFLILFLSIQTTAIRENNQDVSIVSSNISRQAEQFQGILLNKIDQLSLSDQEKAVLSGITLGYKQSMERETRNRFTITGVAHLLAVSGFHVGIVGSFITLLFFFFPKSTVGRCLKYLFTLLCLWIYVTIIGLPPSAVRAATMLSFYLTGRIIRKNTDSYNTLVAAAFCMLVYNPFYLFDIGFQLSYGAVLFILCLQPRFQKQIDVRNPLLAAPWSWITVTLAAQTGVTFLCLYYFGQISGVFLLSNVPFTFLSTLLIPVSLVWLILPSSYPMYDVLKRLVEFLTNTTFNLVEKLSDIPGITISYRFDGIDLIVAYMILFTFIFYKYYKLPKWLLVSLSFVLIFLLKKTGELLNIFS